MSNSPNKKTTTVTPKRKIDIYLSQYADTHQNPTYTLVQAFCVPLIFLGLLGLSWATPFPNLRFLGQYRDMFNWASFLIAFLVYYYYKLSPNLSYFIFLGLLGLTYGVTILEGWQKAGGPALWQTSLIVFLLSFVAYFAGNRLEKKTLVNAQSFLIAPVWLLSLVLTRFKIKY